MQCHCLYQVKEQIQKSKEAKFGKPVTVEMPNVGFILTGKKVGEFHFTNFIVKADVAGYRKGKDFSVFSSYCPVCGKPTAINKEDSDETE